MLQIFRTLWGDLTNQEFKKFGIMASALAFIICCYAMTRPLKDALLTSLVGVQWLPYAKMLSVIVSVFVVLFYGKLVDKFEKHKLFYILCPFYSLLFISLSFFASNTNLNLITENSFLYPLISWIPGEIVGWISYVSIESSSILIALFWSFVASTTSVESAKKGYGFMFFVTEIGAIGGPLIVINFVEKFGSPLLLGFAGVLLLIVPLIIKYFIQTIPADPTIQEVAPKAKTGFLEGLKILTTRPYVMGIFVVSSIYEVVATILDQQMKFIAAEFYPRDALAAFVAKNVLGFNGLALLFALVGTSFFMRKFGLRFCLIAFPSMIGIIISGILLTNNFGISQYQIMWIFFASLIVIKGLNYALNNPTKEVMYIPTSKDVKFKAKSWIDVFGNRTTKSMGSGVVATFKSSIPNLFLYGSLISLGVVGFWIFIAFFVGKKFHRLQEDKSIIE